ncbi:hypothetical protein Vadar_002073 [Vaccinium darrowii]|uniref:Uncharacterized protein n=1 Tax=Vaccinium darrowii TaxID=229202 RepID=A0ACB7X7F1_9ERIC|nr:hypothetical protein Vadar_002073 [Vaccinium darrowii]
MEKEIERMVMEISRAEFLADNKFKQQRGWQEFSTSGAEPSSSGPSVFPLFWRKVPWSILAPWRVALFRLIRLRKVYLRFHGSPLQTDVSLGSATTPGLMKSSENRDDTSCGQQNGTSTS